MGLRHRLTRMILIRDRTGTSKTRGRNRVEARVPGYFKGIANQEAVGALGTGSAVPDFVEATVGDAEGT